MSPASSLIFVVVIVTWATCLSLYAMRRREQLTTARSVDRFSAHMRVLQRRSGKLVRRPEPVTSSGTAQSSMLVAGSRFEVHGQGVRDDERAARGGVRGNDATSRVRRGVDDAQETGAVRPNHAFAVWGSLTAASAPKVRAAAFGLATVVVAASFLLGVFGRLGWVLPVVAGMAACGLMVSLRRNRRVVVAARRRREAAASNEAQRVVVEHLAVGRMAAGASLASLDTASSPAQMVRQGRRSASELPVALERTRPATGPSTTYVARRERKLRSSRDVPFDVAMLEEELALRSCVAAKRKLDEFERSDASPVGIAGLVPLEAMSEWELDASVLPPGLDAGDPLVAERSWQPVPVPVPTYVMKAPARRPLRAPQVPGVPVPIEIEDDFDDVLWSAGKRVVNV